MFWKEEVPTPKSLAGELRRWKQLWSNDDPQSQPVPSNFVQALASCDAESYRNIYNLLIIGCTLPITSAEAERTFLFYVELRHTHHLHWQKITSLTLLS